MKKKKPLYLHKVTVRRSAIHGYGVFADVSIKKGERLEDCHVIKTSNEDEDFMDYYFDAGPKYNAILLGFGCIYNHSDEPNASITFSHDYSSATVRAIRAIKKGDEILISYGKAWFKTRKLKSTEVS